MAAFNRLFRCFDRKGLLFFSVPWKVYIECRTQAGFTVYIDEPLILLDNAVYSGQSEPGTFGCFLGGEKTVQRYFAGFPASSRIRCH